MRVRPAMVASVALHAAVILGALVSWPFTRREATTGAPVPVSIITTPVPAPAVPAPEPTPAATPEPVPDASTEAAGETDAPPEPPPPPAPAPEPQPTPSPPAPRPRAQAPRPVAQAPAPRPRRPTPPRPTPPREEAALDLDALAESLPTPRRNRQARPRSEARLDLDSLSESLNPRPRSGPRRSSAERGPTRPRAAPSGPAGANGRSEETALALGLISERVGDQWNICSTPGAEQVRVNVTFSLDQGGRLTGDPSSDVSPESSGVRGIAAQRALEAVRRAQPFDTLPPERHAEWRRVTIRFNGREACG